MPIFIIEMPITMKPIDSTLNIKALEFIVNVLVRASKLISSFKIAFFNTNPIALEVTINKAYLAPR